MHSPGRRSLPYIRPSINCSVPYRIPACVVSLVLVLAVAWPVVPAGAAAPRHTTAAPVARLIHLYGYLHDAHPDVDGILLIYSKAHRTTYKVAMTAATVVQEHRRTVPRATLRAGQYVIASCTRRSDGMLEAMRVTIVIRHARPKKH